MRGPSANRNTNSPHCRPLYGRFCMRFVLISARPTPRYCGKQAAQESSGRCLHKAPASNACGPHTASMTSGTHARTQQVQHLDSKQYHDATSRDSPDSWLPWAHVGRSTRGLAGRTPLMLRPSSYGSTSGRGLTSCRMRAPGDTIGYNGVVLPPLPQRPPGQLGRAFCCPVPMRAHSPSACRPVVSRR